MKIILVRHGESKANAGITEEKNSRLTRRGKIQAKHLGNSLKKQKISAIYTSNLLRARETGEIISNIIRVPIKGSFDELSEYPSRHLKSILIRLFNTRAKKLKKLLKKISKEREKDKTILIVAHGIANKVIIGYLLEIPLRKQLLRFQQHNTGINVLYWNKNYQNWGLESMNDVEHLPKRLRGYRK